VTEGPVGSVVLWHANLLHMAGQNQLSDVIRQATIYAFAKTVESVPDEVVKRDPRGDLWRDWSDEVRSIDAAK
jgi:ectoine hydroxylase-related dioxygenase (phytanoyl-CoA dioxygenase family)